MAKPQRPVGMDKLSSSVWTLSFGLSYFHGHDSWLVCEVALSVV